MGFLFVSHSSRDKHIVEPVCKFLETNGIDCWIDKEDIPVAKDFRGAVMRAIESEECDALLLFLSFSSASSKEVDTEVAIARDSDKTIIVYKIHRINLDKRLGLIRWDIRRSQIIDASDDPLSRANLNLLLETLRNDFKPFIDDTRTILENKLKGFELTEGHNKSDSKFYSEWGKTIMDFAETFPDAGLVSMLEQARLRFEQALQLEKTFPNIENMVEVLLALASTTYDLKIFGEAEKYLREVISLRNDDYKLYWKYADLLAKWAKADKTRRPELLQEVNKNFEKAAEINPDDYHLFLDWANHLCSLCDTDSHKVLNLFSAACEKYQTAYHLNPRMDNILNLWNKAVSNWAKELGLENTSDGWFFDTDCRSDRGPRRESLDLLYKLANAIFCYSQSKLTAQTSNIKEAIKAEITKMLSSSIEKYKYILRENNRNLGALNNLGVTLARLGLIVKNEELLREADECFQTLVSYDGANPRVFYNWGTLFFEWSSIVQDPTDLLKNALTQFKAAISLDPKMNEAHNSIGLAYLTLAERSEGLEAYRLRREAVQHFRTAGEV